MPPKKYPYFNILSISGGGIKGIIPATVLAEMEAKTGKRIVDMFDLIVGTSTGGIIAAAIGAGKPAAEIADMYQSKAGVIFGRTLAQKITSADGLTGPKYQASGLHDTVNGFLGPASIKTSQVCIMATSADFYTLNLCIFKSWTGDFDQFSFSDIALATSAAPTYFPAYKTKGFQFIDGGMFANYPVLIGMEEGFKAGYSAENIRMLSIGTGYLPQKGFDSTGWGDIQWIRHGGGTPIIDTVFELTKQKDLYLAGQRLGKNFYHTDVELLNDSMDDVSTQNLNALKLAGQKLAADDALQQFLKKLL